MSKIGSKIVFFFAFLLKVTLVSAEKMNHIAHRSLNFHDSYRQMIYFRIFHLIGRLFRKMLEEKNRYAARTHFNILYSRKLFPRIHE